MTTPKGINVIALVAICLAGCTSALRPETRLHGKWQSVANKDGLSVQFEFLVDGSVIRNERQSIEKSFFFKASKGEWGQVGTGTFKFIDPTHIKMELQPNWWFGTPIYEVAWQDNDHVEFRAAGKTIQLARLK